MPKLFIISDVHSFYDEMIDALNKAGFDKNNNEHWLISCGDDLDRGDQSQEVLDFLNRLERKVLVRGNHLTLLEECLDNECYFSHDISNRTVKTIMNLAKINDYGVYPDLELFSQACAVARVKIREYAKCSVNYFETENYIFVHSWIPFEEKCVYDSDDVSSKLYRYKIEYNYNENWRYAHFEDWEEARWVNPFKMASKNLNKTGKIIVSGHWNCSAYWARTGKRSEFGENAKFDIAYDKRHKFIGIDACTAHTGKVNVLVIEDDFLEEENYE